MTETEKHSPNNIFVVTGLGLGEETKGAWVQKLTDLTGAHTILRSGGCQCGHNVVAPDGTHTQLSHFGCGTFDGARTHLQHMVFFPTNLFEEAMELEEKGIKDPFSVITIDEDCLTITPFHGAWSRILEISRGYNKKGTVGMGVGEAIEDSKKDPSLAVKAGNFSQGEEILHQKVEAIRQYQLQKARELVAVTAGLADLAIVQKEFQILEDESLVPLTVQSFLYLADLVHIVGDEYLDEILNQEGAIVCEPSHGALHHPRYGFVPHITQIDPTSQDVLETLKKHEHKKDIVRLGVSRCYMTRYGWGPLPSFSRQLTDQIKETHNVGADWWLGEFRNGYYDPILLEYAIEFSGGKESFNGLIISFLDVLTNYQEWPVIEAYAYEGEPTSDLDQYFDLKDGKIVGIKVHPDSGDQAHLDHQIRLTELIKKCRPITTILKSENELSLEEVFLKYVEKRLGLPVVAVARGPKDEDREIRPGWKHLFGLTEI